jgi:GNAT superfamily N-acetyltransferase
MSCLAPPMLSVRDFVPEVDAFWVHGLWHRALHGRWAISLEAMLSTLADAALLLVAEYEGLRSGFCAVDTHQGGGSAGLTLLLIDPTRQRHGVGTELLSRAEQKLRERGVHSLALGAGNRHYFWPGLPEEQGKAWSFFRERGFNEEESSEDLIQELQGFETPTWVTGRLASSGCMLRLAEPAHQSRIAAFEKLQFPAWATYFDNEMEQGGYSNILVAQSPDGCILGTLLLRHDTPTPWTIMSRKKMGTLNTLGVALEQQGKGIGLALTSKALEILSQRGCSHCFIQWTGLTEWYGKLGATTWAQYHMASKLI